MIDRRHMEDLLRGEILEVTGCTEPVSVAYAFLNARRHLTRPFDPARIKAELVASPGLLRNASTAVVPFLDRRGLRTAVAAGLSSRACQFNLLPKIDHPIADRLLRRRSWLTVITAWRKQGVHVRASLSQSGETVCVIIEGHHDEIRIISRNGKRILRHPARRLKIPRMEDIWNCVARGNRALENIALDFIVRQVRGNASLPMPDRIADLIRNRMNGLPLPIMTLGGSGNHGILLGVPLYDLYKRLGRRILPAALFALLTDIHLTGKKRRISDACGLATKAAPALAAGLAYAHGATLPQIMRYMNRVSSDLNHMVCHGARPGCGNKGTMAYHTVMAHLDLPDA